MEIELPKDYNMLGSKNLMLLVLTMMSLSLTTLFVYRGLVLTDNFLFYLNGIAARNPYVTKSILQINALAFSPLLLIICGLRMVGYWRNFGVIMMVLAFALLLTTMSLGPN